MSVKHWLHPSLKSGLRVAMTPNMDPDKRHGSVWFDVSGFGEQRRDFLINEPDRLVKDIKRLGIQVAEQIMLLDPTLPEQNIIPVKIDVVGSAVRRLYALNAGRILLEQKLL